MTALLLIIISCFILSHKVYPRHLELSRTGMYGLPTFKTYRLPCFAGIIADRRKQLEEEIEDLMNRDDDAENKDKNGEERDADTSRDDANTSPTKDNTNRCAIVYLYLKKKTTC